MAANLRASKCLIPTLSFVSLFLNTRSCHDPTGITHNSQALFAQMMFYKKKAGQTRHVSQIKQSVTLFTPWNNFFSLLR
jgi:hypothetical protein